MQETSVKMAAKATIPYITGALLAAAEVHVQSCTLADYTDEMEIPNGPTLG